MLKKQRFITVIAASSTVVIAVTVWFIIGLAPRLDRCLDSGGKWDFWHNECMCGSDHALGEDGLWCALTLTGEIRESMAIVRGRCERIVSKYQDNLGAYVNRLEFEISEVLAGISTGTVGRREFAYYGNADVAGACTGNDLIIILQTDFGSAGGYRFSRVTFFPISEIMGSGEEFVSLDDPVGFSLYSHENGRPYEPDWQMVPYDDFLFSLRKVSESGS